MPACFFEVIKLVLCCVFIVLYALGMRFLKKIFDKLEKDEFVGREDDK